nr:MAG TPA: hypothetical protein [Caudoviricetes sp.]
MPIGWRRRGGSASPWAQRPSKSILGPRRTSGHLRCESHTLRVDSTTPALLY